MTGPQRPAAGQEPKPRDLTPREREVLELMVGVLPPDHPARDEVGSAQVVGTCGCGTCPSVDLLTDVPPDADRVVVCADHTAGLVLLFVDGGRPSYLELAPWGDEPVLQFPPAAEITEVRVDDS